VLGTIALTVVVPWRRAVIGGLVTLGFVVIELWANRAVAEKRMSPRARHGVILDALGAGLLVAFLSRVGVF
jgi:hypothetical protein